MRIGPEQKSEVLLDPARAVLVENRLHDRPRALEEMARDRGDFGPAVELRRILDLGLEEELLQTAANLLKAFFQSVQIVLTPRTPLQRPGIPELVELDPILRGEPRQIQETVHEAHRILTP